MRHSWWLGLVVGALAGCGSNGGWAASSYHDRGPVYDDWAWRRHGQVEPRRDAPPDHRLSDAEVERALAAAPAPAAPAEVEPALAEAPVPAAAAEVAAAFRRGERERARALVAAHPRLVDWSDPLVVVSARFVGGEHGVELTCIRTDTAAGSPREALGVVFEPGTYGIPVGDLADDGRWTSPETERRFGHWPTPQDLAMLRAPVVVIPRGEALAVTYVPVACASFHRGAPDPGTPYALARFPAGSTIDRLMVALCQGDAVPDEAEAQLATWLARDDVTWADFVAQGGDRGRLVTFGRARSVRAGHAEGAARLLLRAGVDPRPLRFFDPTGARGAPAAPPAPAPEETRTPAPAPPPAAPRPTEPAQPASQLS